MLSQPDNKFKLLKYHQSDPLTNIYKVILVCLIIYFNLDEM